MDHAWLQSQLASDRQDNEVLAIGMQYTTGKPPLFDADDLQIAGNAHYGPHYNLGRGFELDHADDGTLHEGSDWNDYLGIPGDYSHLGWPDDPPEKHEFRCLDCSGLVRMIFGYRLGMPMAPKGWPATQHDRIRIPRRAHEQRDYGPGAVVFAVKDKPPAKADIGKLLPDDVVFFDGDTTNTTEVEGQIDHMGIYLGEDTGGKPRFFSARKSINCPSFADLGGSSALTGNGHWAQALRVARRY